MGRKKVGIVGLPFWEIDEDAQNTLVGIRVRSWALFTGLSDYDVEAFLYVEADAVVGNAILQKYGDRFIRDEAEFLRRSSSEFDHVIMSSTKLETLLAQQPWVRKLKGASVIGAFCYHNTPMHQTIRMKPLLDQIVAAGFVSPIHQMHWRDQKCAAPTFSLTTGQTPQPPVTAAGNMDTVFVGDVRSLERILLLCDIARQCADRNHTLVCPKIIEQRENNKVHLNFLEIDRSNHRSALSDFLRQHGAELPENLLLDLVPAGEDRPLMDKAGVALDFSWRERYELENSKVSRYLTCGLQPVVEMPSPSHRYLDLFKVGKKLAFGSDASSWSDAIKSLPPNTVKSRNELRDRSGQFFAWDKVVFEIASIIRGLEMRDEYRKSLIGKVMRKIGNRLGRQ